MQEVLRRQSNQRCVYKTIILTEKRQNSLTNGRIVTGFISELVIKENEGGRK